jgi:hypothetical protein
LLFIKGGNASIDNLDKRKNNTDCRQSMKNLTAQLQQTMSQHLARVKQYFVLPAGYENASEAQRNQYYEKRCEGYMKLCSMAITSLQPLQIRMLVGLMKATGMVDDMDLQVCKSQFPSLSAHFAIFKALFE